MKKPFEIITAEDGTVTLDFGNGIAEKFRDIKTMRTFAMELKRRVSERRTEMFRLHDREDGRLAIEFSKSHNILNCKDYNQASLLADLLYDEAKDIINQ
jgi:hypothetical protein